MYHVIVIGCGIIGAAVAMELSKYQLSVAVLEGENDVAQGLQRPTPPSSMRALTPNRGR